MGGARTLTIRRFPLNTPTYNTRVCIVNYGADGYLGSPKIIRLL